MGDNLPTIRMSLEWVFSACQREGGGAGNGAQAHCDGTVFWYPLLCSPMVCWRSVGVRALGSVTPHCCTRISWHRLLIHLSAALTYCPRSPASCPLPFCTLKSLYQLHRGIFSLSGARTRRLKERNDDLKSDQLSLPLCLLMTTTHSHAVYEQSEKLLQSQR